MVDRQVRGLSSVELGLVAGGQMPPSPLQTMGSASRFPTRPPIGLIPLPGPSTSISDPPAVPEPDEPDSPPDPPPY
jgi:hypothetical protein